MNSICKECMYEDHGKCVKDKSPGKLGCLSFKEIVILSDDEREKKRKKKIKRKEMFEGLEDVFLSLGEAFLLLLVEVLEVIFDDL